MRHESTRFACPAIDFEKISMGGFGSGHWYRHRTHNTVDSLPEFFASNFNNSRGEVTARTRDELRKESICFRYIRNGNMIVLFFSKQEQKDSDEALAPIIKIVSTPCHFGGGREWLLCPELTCGRRVGSLFIDEHHRIACRKCLGLLYESQYGGGIEKRMARLRTMHRKILRGGIKQIAVAYQTRQQFQSLIDDLKKFTV